MTGIYFLKQGDKIVYIGQSVNIERRIREHTNKTFDNYQFIECPVELLDSTEMAYITRYTPEYNIIGVDRELIKSYRVKPKYEISGKNINVNVDAEKWERFKKIAKINNSTASQEIRKFIDRYLSENSQLDLKV